MEADLPTVSDDKNESTVAASTDADDGDPALKCPLSTEGNPTEDEHGIRQSASGSGLKRQLDEGTGPDELDVNAKRLRLMTVSDSPVPTPESSTSSPRPHKDSPSSDSNKRKTPHATGENAGGEDDTNESEGPPTKRVELTGPPDVNSTQENITPKPSPITCLPLEILAEILLFTRCPISLLAVSRTCKALCAQLLSPDASFIWKQARIAVNLPDPEAFSETMEGDEPNTTATGVKCFVGREAAYAAWVFDGGICESCKEKTKRMYISFSLGLRTCKKEDCIQAVREQLFNETRDYAGSDSWSTIPVLESTLLLPEGHLTDQITIWPSIIKASRAKFIKTAAEKYANQGQGAIDRALARTNTWMKFCVALYQWQKGWKGARRLMKEANRTMSSKFAKKEGWDYPDVCATNSFIKLSEDKLKRREPITITELTKLRPAIAKELYQLQEGRKAKNMAKIQQANRTHVWKFYQKLMSQRAAYRFLPSFSSFLKLPAIELLQSSHLVTANIGVKTVVTQKSFMDTVIKQQIDQWVEQAKDDLLDSLGCSKEWSGMVPALRMPHPVLRPDARWKCRVCDQVEKKYEVDGCLDFAGVCQHECKEKGIRSRRKGTTTPWRAANFVRDEQACSVLKTCLGRLISRMGEKKDIHAHFMRTIWLCESCNPPLLVHAESLAGHSHRHTIPMKVEYMTAASAISWPSDATLWPNPFGFTQWLLSDKKKSEKWAQKKIYACNYCYNTDDQAQTQEKRDKDDSNSPSLMKRETLEPGMSKTETTETEVNRAGESTKQRSSNKAEGKPSSRFCLNGLRCHLSSKHEIHQIRDEDYFYSRTVSEITHGQDQALVNAFFFATIN